MDLLTVDEVAKLLKISPITVRRHIASGDLSAVRAGRAVRVRRDSAETFLKPIVQPSLVEAERARLFAPPTPEELARRREAVDRAIKLQKALGSRPGPSAVELIRMAREEEGPSYDPGGPSC
jgi:excisionase family DNA binding protein